MQLSELFSTALNISHEKRRNKVSSEAGIPALCPDALIRVVQHLFFRPSIKTQNKLSGG